MPKLLKIIRLSIIGVLIITIGFSGLYLILQKSELSKFHPLKTGCQVDNVYAINDDFVNMFLIKKSDRYIAIDAGNNATAIKKGLQQLHIDPGKVGTILLTHTDYDHVAGLKLFTHAKVYLSRPEEKMINGRVHRFAIFNNHIDKPYHLLEDHTSVSINGFTVQTIVTPGHTVGSACFVIDGQYLFTGDTLSLHGKKVGHFNEFFNMNTMEQVHSIQKIAHLPKIKYLFTAHYGMTRDYEKAFRQWNIIKK
jgi:glyoxylase-like metal-dependent hydrolase (beta-lactamase superfamily II)